MRHFLHIALISAAVALCHSGSAPLAAQEIAKDAPLAPQPTRTAWEEHFAKANLAHDGRLTQDEAKAGFPTISRHFRAIDVDGKGFVTENDIRAWKAMQRAVRHQPREVEDPLRPRSAFKLNLPDQRPMNTNTNRTVPLPTASSKPPDNSIDLD